eukprot:TRINITY_DN17529_c0_g1_i1.p1 TRINITY_DN17529_c0_g1~~TRINITY_DN17529_c0_g1_i1.p1  ORF type:complete len:111 (-),score=32.01 TRINITY_DN17529_c0_g1_i1:58-357(-)
MDEIIAHPEDSVRVVGITRGIFRTASEIIKDAKEWARAEPDPEKKTQLSNIAQTFVRSLTTFVHTAKESSITPQDIHLRAAAQDVKNSISPLEEAMSTS